MIDNGRGPQCSTYYFAGIHMTPGFLSLMTNYCEFILPASLLKFYEA